MFHERHFRFAMVFLEAALRQQGCSASLNAVSRWTPSFRLSLMIGGAETDSGSALAAGFGVDMSLWSTREHHFETFLGARAGVLVLPSAYRSLFMIGGRLGIRAQTNPVDHGVVGELFGEAGASVPFGGVSGAPGPEGVAPYVGGGVGLRYRAPLGGGARFTIGAEVLAGTELRDDDVSALFTNDAQARYWLMYGLNLGVTF
jgi:hypothetical protein